ncbi:winged helix-turn-helix domain-containing protein [Aeromonas hydrophila]|uniref:winged helix-turn-helix domain-containing protein n=1 Tax=Aeromonas hydrophila TaxID=644 RepID=UPI00191FDEA5|nr:winged helix-turn-helix domain-containing protein [Aeromonas hydrophila]MBL0568139.1 winged helix-turn-helix domain-containing protein [Aeromonas hydrophila]
MDPDHAPHLHTFGRFVLDSKQLTLTRSQDGNPTSVRVSAAEARLLHFFLNHAGSLHSKETLLTIGWDGRPVSASSLPVAIANLRRYLDTPEQEAVIRTLPRQGYLLMLSPAAMQVIPTASTPSPSEPTDPAPLPEVDEPVAALSVAASRDAVPIPLPRWQQRLLLGVMGLFLALLLLTGLYLSATWVSVRCEAAGQGTLCRTQKAASHLPTPAAGEIWLMVGEEQAKFEEKKP